jgi:carbon monoxide dehydrogenase subunit G
MATIRREVRIGRPAEQVWTTVGDPGTIQDWFPGIVDSTVEGSTRTITLASGVPLAEEIVTNDPILRRFQYRIEGGFFRQHLGTVDVLALDEESCLVVYSTDAEPDVMALVIGGAAGNALHELQRQFESGRHDEGPVPAGTTTSDGSTH